MVYLWENLMENPNHSEVVYQLHSKCPTFCGAWPYVALSRASEGACSEGSHGDGEYHLGATRTYKDGAPKPQQLMCPGITR